MEDNLPSVTDLLENALTNKDIITRVAEGVMNSLVADNDENQHE
jgi:hypothetical protein